MLELRNLLFRVPELVDIIARVGVCAMDFLDKPVDSKLSGGEIKKMELATVIASQPKDARCYR